jgi:tRNA pseudouridine38-40 synthase
VSLDHRNREDQLPARGVRLRLDVAYRGRDFHGWQIQPDHRTVQGELARQCSRLLGREVRPVGAGRTDAGVNARGQVAHLDVADDEEARRVAGALPRLMPDDIQLHAIQVVEPFFNARFSAIARRYSYRMFFGRDIFRENEWQVYFKLDRRAMDRAAGDFLGNHDFSSFCRTSSLKEDGNVCRVELCAFHWQDDSAIFHVKANRFLHHMVRIMVGTLVEIGQGSRPADCLPEIIAARDRSRSGRMAPPEGLFLEEVCYPEVITDPFASNTSGQLDDDSPTNEGTPPPEGENT